MNVETERRVVHCLGARMQALLDAGRERDAHEYLAETLAPAMVKIQSTPRARPFAKAVKQLPKDRSMDMLSLCMALLKEIAASPGISPELKAKIDLIMSQENQPAQTTEPAEPSTMRNQTSSFEHITRCASISRRRLENYAKYIGQLEKKRGS